jgi:RimJ/RimL family protein N-acetyltransferase
MLDIALKYTDQLKRLHLDTWHNDKYKYYNYRCYWELPKLSENTVDGHDFVSLNSKGEIIGAIGYCILRDLESVCGLGIINFTDDPTFGKDVLQSIKDIFEKFNFRKLNFCVVIGNPIEKTYDRLAAKYGGRIVGIEKEETKLADNKYYDVKRYEILRKDYMKAKEKHKND